jgi:hypothetical protein
MKANEFVGHLFLARNVAHSVHLNTRNYAKHVALQGFYDGIIDLADQFAEAYQGRHGLMGAIPVPAVRKTSNVLEFLQESLAAVEKSRYEVCEKDDSPIQNIIDEIVGLYLSTIYKLRFLA